MEFFTYFCLALAAGFLIIGTWRKSRQSAILGIACFAVALGLLGIVNYQIARYWLAVLYWIASASQFYRAFRSWTLGEAAKQISD